MKSLMLVAWSQIQNLNVNIIVTDPHQNDSKTLKNILKFYFRMHLFIEDKGKFLGNKYLVNSSFEKTIIGKIET